MIVERNFMADIVRDKDPPKGIRRQALLGEYGFFAFGWASIKKDEFDKKLKDGFSVMSAGRDTKVELPTIKSDVEKMYYYGISCTVRDEKRGKTYCFVAKKDDNGEIYCLDELSGEKYYDSKYKFKITKSGRIRSYKRKKENERE